MLTLLQYFLGLHSGSKNKNMSRHNSRSLVQTLQTCTVNIVTSLDQMHIFTALKCISNKTLQCTYSPHPSSYNLIFLVKLPLCCTQHFTNKINKHTSQIFTTFCFFSGTQPPHTAAAARKGTVPNPQKHSFLSPLSKYDLAVTQPVVVYSFPAAISFT